MVDAERREQIGIPLLGASAPLNASFRAGPTDSGAGVQALAPCSCVHFGASDPEEGLGGVRLFSGAVDGSVLLGRHTFTLHPGQNAGEYAARLGALA